MGAGCHYTLKETGDRAYWISLGEDIDDITYEEVLDNLISIVGELPQCKKYGMVPNTKGYENSFYYLDSYIVSFESTYYGDGIVINFEFQELDNSLSGLQEANYHNSYMILIRHINKSYNLNIASSGSTSSKISVGSIK